MIIDRVLLYRRKVKFLEVQQRSSLNAPGLSAIWKSIFIYHGTISYHIMLFRGINFPMNSFLLNCTCVNGNHIKFKFGLILKRGGDVHKQTGDLINIVEKLDLKYLSTNYVFVVKRFS